MKKIIIAPESDSETERQRQSRTITGYSIEAFNKNYCTGVHLMYCNSRTVNLKRLRYELQSIRKTMILLRLLIDDHLSFLDHSENASNHCCCRTKLAPHCNILDYLRVLSWHRSMNKATVVIESNSPSYVIYDWGEQTRCYALLY